MLSINQVWAQFQGVPIETFTKGWWHRHCGGAPRQRTVAEMRQHRAKFGVGGNCFDLALWLRQELLANQVPARIVGHDLGTPDAHVAVLAADNQGAEYLCDLGDLWLQPIRLDAAGWQAGYFPGRDVSLTRSGEHLEVLYRRTNGKVGRQTYDLRSVPEAEFAAACHHSQNLLRRPFCEMLLPHPDTGRTEHWEYDREASFWNLADGPVFEAPCATRAEWVAHIAARTSMAPDLIAAGFTAYE